ncbi:hypothetical protein NMG60_11036845 [Bertholletia excelsa]
MAKSEPPKVVFINTQYVETDATSFKSVVQRLTGKDAVVADGVRRVAAKATGGGKVLARGVSFKDFDRLLTEMPSLDEIFRLCTD